MLIFGSINLYLFVCIDVLPFLMKISLQLNEEMAPLIVKLITIGLSGVSSTETHKRSHSSSKGSSKTSDAAKTKPASKQPGKSWSRCMCIFAHTHACTHMHAHSHAYTHQYIWSMFFLLFLPSPRQGDMCCSSSAANELRAGTSPFENIHTQLHVTFQLLNAEMGYHFMMQYVFQGCDSTRR